MTEQRLQEIERDIPTVTAGPADPKWDQIEGMVRLSDVRALIAEVRRLQQQVENIAAVNDAVGRERDTAFGVRDAALDREAQAKFAIDEIGQRYLDERAAHNSTILTAIAERDAALAERDKAYKAAQDRTDAVGVWERAFQRAVDERDEARRVLGRIEWVRIGGKMQPYCPFCWEQAKDGHTDDCALAAVLAQEEEA